MSASELGPAMSSLWLKVAIGFSAALTALFGFGFAALVRRPGEAVIGYKG